MCACQVVSVTSDPLRPYRPVAHQVPLSTGFSRQEYWSGLPRPPPGDLPDPGMEPASLTSPALAGGFSTTHATWEAPPSSLDLLLNARFISLAAQKAVAVRNQRPGKRMAPTPPAPFLMANLWVFPKRYPLQYSWASLVAQLLKNLPAMQETWVQSLSWVDPLEKGRLPTPIFWPGEFHGLYSPWGRKESDTTDRLSLSDKKIIRLIFLIIVLNHCVCRMFNYILWLSFLK